MTPTGTKIAHEAGDLAGYAGLPRDATDRLLHELSDQRILRPLGRGDAKDERYEIFHDVLAPATLAWRAQHEAERRLAGERDAAKRRHRRLAALAGSALAALAVLAVIAAYALSQRSDAEANAREARARALEAQALALRTTDPEQSLRLALAAAESVPRSESERVLRASLLAARAQTVIQTGGPLVAAGETHGALVAEQADGTSLRVDAAAGRATTLDAAAGRTRAAQVGVGGAIVTSTDGTVAVDGRPIDGVAAADGAALAGDGRRAAILRGTDAVIVSVPDGRALRTLEHPVQVSAVAFAAGGTIATGDVDGVIRLWDAGVAAPRLLRGHAADTRIFTLAGSADGSLVASGGADGTARVWKVVSGDLVAVLSAHDNYVDAVAFSPDAKHLATGSTDHTARIWRIADSRALIVLAGHRGAVRSVAYTSAAGLLTASSDGTMRLWDATPEPALEADAASAFHPGPPGSRAVAPDGTVAAIAGQTVEVVRPDGTRFQLQGHTADVNSVAFSRDGRSIVTASVDHTARIWDATSGRLVHPLRGHFASVSDARFSPDGRWVVTAGPTKVGLWDAETGQQVTYIAGPGGRLTSVAFGDDGRTIAAVTDDGALGTFDCTFCGDLGSLTALARERLQTTGRALSPEERTRYLGG